MNRIVMVQNYYEVLEISEDAKLIDVKKAYRRLALKHHPDRNGGSTESTEKFKEISQAYNILSDETARRHYTSSLRATSKSVSTSSPSRPSNSDSLSRPSNSDTTSPSRQPDPTTAKGARDPFKQFDDLFRNDPFFHGAFEDMDGAFAQKFDNSEDQNRDDVNTANDDDGVGPLIFCGMEGPRMRKQNAKKVPWSEWLMNKLGIEVSVTSISHKADGSTTASAYTSKPFGTYTNKKSRTYVENGQKVSVISMEKDGNKIEDKFIAGELVERKVNGKLEQASEVVTN